MTDSLHPRTFPDFEDKTEILSLLREHLIESTPAANGALQFYYAPGWSDRLIAQEINPAFSPHYAATIRRMKFGILDPHPPVTAQAPPTLDEILTERMDRLEAQIERLTGFVTEGSPIATRHKRYILDGPSSTAHLDDI